MKKLKLLGMTFGLMAVLLSSGCTKVERKEIYTNYAFLTEFSAVNGTTYEKVIPNAETKVEFDFSVSLVDYAEDEVVVTLNINNDALVQAYNNANRTQYESVPQAEIEYSGNEVEVADDGKSLTVTIPVGENEATVHVCVTKWGDVNPMELYTEYAARVQIASVTTGGTINVPKTGNWGSLLFPIVALPQTLDELDLPGDVIPEGKYAAFKFLRDDQHYVLYTDKRGDGEDWHAKFAGNFTVECWLNINQFFSADASDARNTQIFDNRHVSIDQSGDNVKGSDGVGYYYNMYTNCPEFFVRFNQNQSKVQSNIEIKAFDGSNAGSENWKAGEWQHLAIVFNRRNNTLTSYRNGEIISVLDGYPEPKGFPIGGQKYTDYNGDQQDIEDDFKNGDGPGIGTDIGTDYSGLRDGKAAFIRFNMIGGTGTNTGQTMGVREVRIWKSARRPSQVAKYMRLEVDPSEPDLVAYWPLREDTFDDTTKTFENIATWAGDAGEDTRQADGKNWIPKAPDLKLYQWGSGTSTTQTNWIDNWDNTVNFSNVEVTLLDGSKSTGN